MFKEKNANDLYLIRDFILEKKGYTSYFQYMSSLYWSELRIEFYEKNPKQCNLCGELANLSLHHNSYRNLLEKNEINDIVCLCESCHLHLHKLANKCNTTFYRAFAMLKSKKR